MKERSTLFPSHLPSSVTMRVSQSMSIRCAREVNPICGDCLASFATRCCFVDTVLEFLCIRRLSQQRFHNPTPRFPPRGPGGPVPAFHRYYQGATTCCRPFTPRLVSFAWRYHAARLGLCSRRVKAQPQPTGSTLYSATPEADWIRWRRQHLPSS